ncbi:hypothetical protein ACFE04_003693 [Oxalis oulophora]
MVTNNNTINPPSSSSSPSPSLHINNKTTKKDQNGGVNPTKHKHKQVSSRYLSSSSTTTPSVKRFASPLVSRTTNTNTPSPLPSTKRSLSVDRKRQPGPPIITPRTTSSAKPPEKAAAALSSAAKMLISSTRRLSVSFQGESFSLPVSKCKPAANAAPVVVVARKVTPERKRPTAPVENNAKLLDRHRWPARTRQGNSFMNSSLSQSMDFGSSDSVRKKLVGFGSGDIVKALRQSIVDEKRLSLDLGRAGLLDDKDVNSVRNDSFVSGDFTSAASDNESVSSGCTSEGRLKSGSRNIVQSPRFWQDSNSRFRQLQEPGSPLSSTPRSRPATPSKLSQSKRFSNDCSMASPIRGSTRPASPNKFCTPSSNPSPLRGLSPSRVRSVIGGALSGDFGSCTSSPSILSFSVDVRRGKIGQERIVEAHVLRLLYNRYLQWRFVNARANATFKVHRLNAEKTLWNAWTSISELRHSVTLRRIKLLLLRQKLKFTSIIKSQIVYLEEWLLLDRDHSNSLLGAAEALKASTLRLPIVGKAVADIQNVKDAVGSALDVIQAMTLSICSLLLKVEEMDTLMAELVNVAEKEKVRLQQCKDFLSILSAMQVKDRSLRTHIIQLKKCSPTTGNLTTRTLEEAIRYNRLTELVFAVLVVCLVFLCLLNIRDTGVALKGDWSFPDIEENSCTTPWKRQIIRGETILTLGKFPFTGFFDMVSAIATLMIDSLAT